LTTGAYQTLARRLERREIVVLDGGTGTDIQRRGVPMAGATWCAEATLTHPDVVRSVHADYIAAGAQVITANTFATSPLLFEELGRGCEINAHDRHAVALAHEARDLAGEAGEGVAIAGSFSVMRLVIEGTDRTDLSRAWTRAGAMPLFRAKAEALAACGVDLILMEMMRDTDVSVWATEAALETGLPVWVGVSFETRATGRLTGYGRPAYPAADIIDALAPLRPQAMTVMHTSVADTDLALDVVKAAYNGPIGVYPESGHFKMPDWQFAELTPSEFVHWCHRWRAAGATVLGGCCGIGPSHISALSASVQDQRSHVG